MGQQIESKDQDPAQVALDLRDHYTGNFSVTGETDDTITVDPLSGTADFNVERDAARLALITGKNVTFIFNTREHTVSTEQARTVFTPDYVQREIGYLEERAGLARRDAQSFDEEAAIERRFLNEVVLRQDQETS